MSISFSPPPVLLLISPGGPPMDHQPLAADKNADKKMEPTFALLPVMVQAVITPPPPVHVPRRRAIQCRIGCRGFVAIAAVLITGILLGNAALRGAL